MWVVETFGTVELLVAFVNDRALDGDRFKVANGQNEAGNQVFHLLYQEEGEALVGVAAVAEAEALDAEDAVDAVGAAEAILAGVHKDE